MDSVHRNFTLGNEDCAMVVRLNRFGESGMSESHQVPNGLLRRRRRIPESKIRLPHSLKHESLHQVCSERWVSLRDGGDNTSDERRSKTRTGGEVEQTFGSQAAGGQALNLAVVDGSTELEVVREGASGRNQLWLDCVTDSRAMP